MKKTVAGYELSNGDLWRHSLTVSVAAEVLVKYLNITEAEEVFTAALVHDIGKLVLGAFVKDEIQQIEAMVSKGIAFEVAEYMVLGTNHAEVGAKILEKWGFAADLVNAVKWHHDPENCENDCIFSDLVHVSNALGIAIGRGRDRERTQVEPSQLVTDRLELKPAHLDVLLEQTVEGIEKLSGLFPTGLR
jgi:putative nucleotidyltransferase with HDIG domain